MNLKDLAEATGDINPTAPAFPDKLSPAKARQGFIFDAPSTVVTRRTDRMKLSKTKDLNLIKQDLEFCFERMLTALSSTNLQGMAAGKINQLRSQLYSLIDAQIRKQEPQ